MKKINVLVLCTGNSCRSQMMEGYLRHFGGEKLNALSAGIETHGLNPIAIGVMSLDGVDISKQTSDLAEQYLDIPLDYLITVCDHANEHCPVFHTVAKKIHHSFSDPAKASGTSKEVIRAFTETRDEIKVCAQNFVNSFI